MTDTVAATSTEIEQLHPADARLLAAQWRESQRLAQTAVIPRSITHHREKVGNQWQDVANHPDVIRATVFAVVRYGNAFGYPPAVALSKIDVIEGRLEPRYDALLGLMMDDGHQCRWREMNAEQATLAVRRYEDRDDPDGWQVFTFTLDEARAAGYVKERPDDRELKGAWYTRRADMLASKVAKRAFRLVASDSLMQRADQLIDGTPVDDMVATARAAGLTETARAGAPNTGTSGGDPESSATGSPRPANPDEDIVDAEIVTADEIVGGGTGAGGAPASAVVAPTDETPPPTAPPPTEPAPMTDAQRRKLHVLLAKKKGAVGPTRHRVLSELLEREITTASALTFADARTAIDALEQLPDLDPVDER